MAIFIKGKPGRAGQAPTRTTKKGQATKVLRHGSGFRRFLNESCYRPASPAYVRRDAAAAVLVSSRGSRSKLTLC